VGKVLNNFQDFHHAQGAQREVAFGAFDGHFDAQCDDKERLRCNWYVMKPPLSSAVVVVWQRHGSDSVEGADLASRLRSGFAVGRGVHWWAMVEMGNFCDFGEGWVKFCNLTILRLCYGNLPKF
jgi:hypothetical protein